jgi:hypothetical protein
MIFLEDTHDTKDSDMAIGNDSAFIIIRSESTEKARAMIVGIPRTWDVLEACVAPGWPDSGGYKEMGHPPETFSGHLAFASGEFWFGKTDGYTPQSADFLFLARIYYIRWILLECYGQRRCAH